MIATCYTAREFSACVKVNAELVLFFVDARLFLWQVRNSDAACKSPGDRAYFIATGLISLRPGLFHCAPTMAHAFNALNTFFTPMVGAQ